MQAAGTAVVVDRVGSVLASDHVDRLHPAFAEAPADKGADGEVVEGMGAVVLTVAAGAAAVGKVVVAGNDAVAAVAVARRAVVAAAEIVGEEDIVGVGHKAVGGIGVLDVAVAVADTASHRIVEDGPRHWEAPGKGYEAYEWAWRVERAGESAAEEVFVCGPGPVYYESAVSLTEAVGSRIACSGHLLRQMHRPLPPLP